MERQLLYNATWSFKVDLVSVIFVTYYKTSVFTCEMLERRFECQKDYYPCQCIPLEGRYAASCTGHPET